MQPKALRTLLIGADEAMLEQLHQALVETSPLILVRRTGFGFGGPDLEGLLNLENPSAIFVDCEDVERALWTTAAIRRAGHHIQVVAYSTYIGTEDLLRLVRAGVREWVQSPASRQALGSALERIHAELEHHPDGATRCGELISFVPAKPGSGASTLAAHVASACARLLDGSRTMLMDLDLVCGSQAFMTRATGGVSLWEACEQAPRLDATLWDQLVARRESLDLICGRQAQAEARIETQAMQTLLGFAIGRYPVAVADHSGNFERFSVQTLEQSSKIFYVCATDLPSLHLARRNLELFREIGVIDRLEIVLNRATGPLGLGKQAIREILGRDPVVRVPNAFQHLQSAMRDGLLLESGSAFSESVMELASRITGRPAGGAMGAGRGRGSLLSSTLLALRTAVNSLRVAAPAAQETVAQVEAARPQPVLVAAPVAAVVEAKPAVVKAPVKKKPAATKAKAPSRRSRTGGEAS